MKKLVIGLMVLGTFLLYSLGIRHQVPVISKPSTLSDNSPTNSSAAPATSTGGSSAGTPPASSTGNTIQGRYSDGTYTGSVADAYYGNVQVSVTISSGRITNVKFLQYPNTHPTSVAINQQAMPYLRQEAIQAQSSNVQIVSGATFTSQAFMQSLAAALSQA